MQSMAQAQVLVACADSESRRALAEIIIQCGLKPISAATVSEAQSVLAQQAICLVFCEESLPEGGYREFLTRARDAGFEVPLVVASPLGDAENYLEAMGAGAFDFISPPYIPSQIESLVERRRQTRVGLRLPVRIFGADANGLPFLQFAWTRNISGQGAQLEGVIVELRPGHILGVKYQDKVAHFRVAWVNEPRGARKEREVGISCLNPSDSIWSLGPGL
jgi:CheY-like chemotaxis protein